MDKKKAKTRSGMFKDLFLQEEFSGDRLINNVRFYILFVLLLLALVKAELLEGLVWSRSLKLTLALIGLGYLYTGALFFLYRRKIYHPFIKYVSVTFDVSLTILSIFAYKLEPYQEYAKIFFLARYSIIFWFIIWSLLRYSVVLSVYSGVLAGIEYFLLIIRGNQMTDTVFSFTGADGLQYSSRFDSSEAFLKVVYLLLSGVIAAVVAIRLRRLVVNSISREHEKNELLTQNRIVETINRENAKYLDNIGQGLLLIDGNYTIGKQYSRYLEGLFETDEISGRNFVDFIYPDRAGQSAERAELEKFLKIVITNTTAEFDMIMDVNPLADKKLKIRNMKGGTTEKVVAAFFHRIPGDAGVENVMVIFEDRTEISAARRELEQERHRHESELETISVILKTGPRNLKEFIDESRGALGEALTHREYLGDLHILNKTFREIHSLKGSAASLGFKRIADLAHGAEDLLGAIRDDGTALTEPVRADLKTRIDAIFRELDAVQKLHRSFMEFSDLTREPSDETGSAPLDSFLNSLRAMVSDLSNELNKKVHFTVENTLTSLPFLGKIKNAIIHLVRNSIDHGIEDEYERIGKQKKGAGRMLLKLSEQNGTCVIEVSDDGGGIDFERVKRKAFDKKLLNPEDDTPTEAKLLGVLFTPGFSSRDVVTKVSGRGVGLDVVKDAVHSLNGTISVSTKRDRGTKFTLKIPVEGG
jgi:two-component system chemotaxis sensor kinase CheA